MGDGGSTDRRVRRHVVVSGRVQGVAFRATARDEARRLGLAGWVRNHSDGSVEAVFEGPAEAVDRALQWCRRGPSWARVEDVTVREEPPRDEKGFEIR